MAKHFNLTSFVDEVMADMKTRIESTFSKSSMLLQFIINFMQPLIFL